MSPWEVDWGQTLKKKFKFVWSCVYFLPFWYFIHKYFCRFKYYYLLVEWFIYPVGVITQTLFLDTSNS